MTSEGNWKGRSHSNHNKFICLANKKGELTTEKEIKRFLALAIAGEAGELANIFKKGWRGEELNERAAAEELADIYIYCQHLAFHLGVDLDKIALEKVEIVEGRLKNG